MRKAIFWDFDGTLAESNHLWRNSALAAAGEDAESFGITLEALAPYTKSGFPWDKDGPHELKGEAWWEHVFQKFLAAYQAFGMPKERAEVAARKIRPLVLAAHSYQVYPDAAAVLAVCLYKGYKNYLLSNNYPELEEVLEKLYLRPFFSGCIVSGAEGVNKPEEKIFRLAQLRANFPELCYMVGDNPQADIEGGKNAGMRTVYVHPTEFCEADIHAPTLTDILQYL